MTKLDRLNSFLSERLSAAVNEIIYTVSMTIQEYEEESARIRKENDYLKEMLKVTGCGIADVNPGVVSVQPDCNPSSEQELELQRAANPHLKVDKSCIKTEQLYHPTDSDSESETRQTCSLQTDNVVDPPQSVHCTTLLNTPAVDSEIIDYDFPTKIKVESLNTDSRSVDVTDSIDASNQSWSPQTWDRSAENSEQSRAQQSSQRPCGIDISHSASTATLNRPVEFRAAFSYSNRIICTNRLHCTSRHCEMQKRTIAKSSPVWKYFSLKEGDCSKAVCLMCKAVISRGVKEYTTSALLKHLRMKHGKC